MKPLFNIDPRTGEVTLGGRRFIARLRAQELPAGMAPGTSTSLQLGQVRAEVTACMKEDALEGLVLTLVPRDQELLSDEAFYGSADERHSFHERALEAALGKREARRVFTWGSTLVARDKSENVRIHIRYGSGA